MKMVVPIITKYLPLWEHAVYIIKIRCASQQFTWYLKGKCYHDNTETNKKELQTDESQHYMQDKESNVFQWVSFKIIPNILMRLFLIVLYCMIIQDTSTKEQNASFVLQQNVYEEFNIKLSPPNTDRHKHFLVFLFGMWVLSSTSSNQAGQSRSI